MEKITINRAVLDLLWQRRIAHRWSGGERWRIGEQLFFNDDVELEPYCEIFAGLGLPSRMGAFSYTGSQLETPTVVGRYCSIGTEVGFTQSEHPLEWASTSPAFYSPGGHEGYTRYLVEDKKVSSYEIHRFERRLSPPVVMGNDVWVGQGATFSGHVQIGDGAVVGAKALVTRPVPAYAVVGGVPARIIRMRFPEDLVARLMALRWWRFGPDVIQRLDIRDPAGFASRLEDRLAADPPPELNFKPLTAADLKAAATQTGS